MTEAGNGRQAYCRIHTEMFSVVPTLTSDIFNSGKSADGLMLLNYSHTKIKTFDDFFFFFAI